MQRAHGGKQGDKGLRHFSMKVCEKVEQKVRTTYNEVADELVAEFAASPDMATAVDPGYDEKSKRSAGGEAGIRRRVYDALNVLMAMDIITKEKKNILWRGLPTNTEQEGARLQMDLNSRSERMDRKRQHLQDLVSQQISFKQLIERNRSPASAAAAAPASRIALPFIVVNTRKETVIDCEMAEDRQEIFFNFSAPFEIHDDSETLKRMNMQRCPPERIGALVPPGLVRRAPLPHNTHTLPPPSHPHSHLLSQAQFATDLAGS
jgi:transcription factor Dp-1